MKMRELNFLILFIVATVLSGCSEFTRIQKNGSFEEKYEAAITYYEKEDYYRAGLLFDDIRPYSSGKPNAEKILLYSAYCEYNEGSQYVASYGFQKFYQTYPRNPQAQEAMFMYAESLYEISPKANLDQENTKNAIKAYESFLKRYPKTEYKDECNLKVAELQTKLEFKAYENAKLQFKIRHYRAAVMSFDNFIKRYPVSSYNEELTFLKIESQLNYAKMSLERVMQDGKPVYLKKERLTVATDYYREFIDKYPNSKFVKQAEGLYDTILHQLEQLS